MPAVPIAASSISLTRKVRWRHWPAAAVMPIGAISLRDPPGPAEGGEYRPATGGSSAIDAAVEARIDGDPFDAAAEAALIERSWRP